MKFTKWMTTNTGKDAQGWTRYNADSMYGEEYQMVFQKPNGKWKIRDGMAPDTYFFPLYFDTAEQAKSACTKHTICDSPFESPRFNCQSYFDARDNNKEDDYGYDY